MDALILLHKPVGISSRKAALPLKKSFGIKKLGHVGTLDLEASGLLMILTGRATRLQSHLLSYDKEYRGTIKLGIRSSTDDIFGELYEHNETSQFSDPDLRESFLKQVFEKYNGTFVQLSPFVSAKKIAGESSYKKVLRGEEVERKEKEVSLEILGLEFRSSDQLYYHIRVSTGFYVRSFARDIGDLAGVGGVAESIKRSRIGPFDLEIAMKTDLLSEIDSSSQLPTGSFYSLESLCEILPYPSYILSEESAVRSFRQGNPASIRDIESESEYVVMKSADSEMLGLIKKEDTQFKYHLVF